MARIRNSGAPSHKAKIDPDAVAAALGQRPRSLDSGMLLNALVDNFGGPGRFAAAIYGEFAAAKEGSLTRQKILEMISRLTVTVTTQQISKGRSADQMSDEELRDAAASLITRLDTDGPAASPSLEA